MSQRTVKIILNSMAVLPTTPCPKIVARPTPFAKSEKNEDKMLNCFLFRLVLTKIS